MLTTEKPGDVLLVLVSYLPILNEENELKTKPTQYAVRTLNSAGLQPDVILARAKVPLDKKRKEKIAFNCNLREKDIISAPDIESLYEIPLNFEKENLGGLIAEKLGAIKRKKDLRAWSKLVEKIRKAQGAVRIGIVGKYFGTGSFILADSYISVIEAIKHAAAHFGKKPEIDWIDAGKLEKGKNELKKLSSYHGIIVPGGFGGHGVEGKIKAIRFCRENGIPFLGLCYGMQLAIVEFARNVLGLRSAHTTEINPKTKYPVIDILPEQKKLLAEKKYGGTMRLGAWPAVLKVNSVAHSAYRNANPKNAERFALRDLQVSERHRHRYEVNPKYIKRIERRGMIFSGVSPDRRLMEVMELPQGKHPFFVGTQFHPELKSRPLNPHPLFREFVNAAISPRR